MTPLFIASLEAHLGCPRLLLDIGAEMATRLVETTTGIWWRFSSITAPIGGRDVRAETSQRLLAPHSLTGTVDHSKVERLRSSSLWLSEVPPCSLYNSLVCTFVSPKLTTQ